MFKPEAIARMDEIRNRLNYVEDRKFFDGMVAELMRLQDKVKEQEARITEYGWERNPDRMGGQFTDQEILDSYRNNW